MWVNIVVSLAVIFYEIVGLIFNFTFGNGNKRQLAELLVVSYEAAWLLANKIVEKFCKDIRLSLSPECMPPFCKNNIFCLNSIKKSFVCHLLFSS